MAGGTDRSMENGRDVACPGCGRAYHRGRFASGRALHCACGAWVGVRRETGIGRGGRPRFAADSMLGGLARRLRALGYDTTWEPRIADAELIRHGIAEHRVILTRDAPLASEWPLDHLLFITRDAPPEQLREVAAAVPLDRAAAFTRCTRCNTPLEPVDADAVPDRVPPAVLAGGAALSRCPRCDRVYWEGSHTARMRREMESVLSPENDQSMPRAD